MPLTLTPERAGRMKTKVPPIFLTYFMVNWKDVKQFDTEQRCMVCGNPMRKTEPFIDENGVNYEGYACHRDKTVTWVRISRQGS